MSLAHLSSASGNPVTFEDVEIGEITRFDWYHHTLGITLL
jgi:hypothetical protein